MNKEIKKLDSLIKAVDRFPKALQPVWYKTEE